MNTENIKTLAKMLGADRIKISNDWVNFNCPFAKVLHSDGFDKRPSFGISVGKRSSFNCFACNVSGALKDLPYLLQRHLKIPTSRFFKFIDRYDYCEHLPESNNVSLNDVYLKVTNKKLQEIFSKFKDLRLNSWFNNSDIKKWQLRFDPERKAVVFPIFHRDYLIGLKGRVLGTKEHFYYGNQDFIGKRAGIWYKAKNQDSNKIILCEGERDAIYLSRYGLDAWASVGASLTKKQLDAIKMSNKEKVVLFFDNDEAGRHAKEEIIKQCKIFVNLYEVTNYYGCKDPAEIVEKGLLKQAIKSIKPV